MPSPTSVSSPPRAQHSAHLAPVLLVSATLGAIAVSTVIYLLWPTWDIGAESNPAHLPISIGKTLFNVPKESVRMKVQQHSGSQERIDLSFTYPSLNAGEPTKRIDPEAAHNAPPSTNLIFLSIAAHNGSLAPDERVRTIYPRYVDPDTLHVEDGLSRRAFRDDTPYSNEDLFIAASPQIVARCTREGETPGICLTERRIEGADLTFRFPRVLLDNWRDVANAIDRILMQIYKAPSAKRPPEPKN